MMVHRMDSSTGGFTDKHFVLEGLFDSKDDAVTAAEAEGGAGVFDGFGGVLDLENTAVGGESRGGEIVSGA